MYRMTSDRTDRLLTYAVEIFYCCCRTIENFLARAHYYCLCDLYQGCQTKRDCLEGARDYCCVCRILNHYSIDELNTVKRDIFKLTEFTLIFWMTFEKFIKLSLTLTSGTTRLNLSSGIGKQGRKVDHT